MPRKLLFIGDSLTEYYDWQERFPAYQVINLGLASETVEGLQNRLERMFPAIEKPEIVFLQSGINDIAAGHTDFMESYRLTVSNLTSWFPTSTLVIQSILPVSLSWVKNSTIQGINQALRTIARQYGVQYLDLYSLFVDSQGNPRTECLLDDGVHLSAAGYKTWADTIEVFLKNHKKVIL